MASAVAMVRPERAANEVLRRRAARNDLLDFTAYTHPAWTTGKHHRKICDALMKVERGECDRLMIFAPPRHSKSELASRRFPAWYLGRHPDRQIITACYGEELASDIGADVRDILRDDYYTNIFPGTVLRKDTTASTRWRTEQGGIYVASGVGGPIVGRGAHLAIIDDPHKNREDVDSVRRRTIILHWYMSTLLTRLMPGGAIVLMMTRWHEDDLAGALLDSGDKWEILTLPAIAEENTPKERALWPEWYPLPALHRTRKTMVDAGRIREWKAQYQQTPTAEEGTYIKREWFEDRYEKRPKYSNIYMASDFAITSERDGRDPDWTEHGVFGMGDDGRLYILDWWSGREQADVWIDHLLDLFLKWKPLCWFGEAGMIRRAIEGFLEKRMRERKAYARVEWISSPGGKDKAVRGRAFQAMSSARRIVFPQAPWADEIIEQCVAFPGGSHDDKFDVCSLMCLVIDEAHPGIVPRSEDKKPRDRYTRPTSDASLWKTR